MNKKLKPKEIERQNNVEIFEKEILSEIDLNFMIGVYEGPMYRIYFNEDFFMDYYPKGQRAGINIGRKENKIWIDLPLNLVIPKIKELTDC